MLNEKNTSDNTTNTNLVKKYITEIKKAIQLTDEIDKILITRIFSIKVTMSAIKSGDMDNQKKEIAVNLLEEVNKIENGLSKTNNYLKTLKSRIDDIKQTKTNTLNKHIEKIKTYINRTDKLINHFKEIFPKIKCDDLSSIKDIDLKKLSDDYIDEWHFNLIND